MFPSKRKILVGLAGVSIVLGAAGVANAASTSHTATPAVATADTAPPTSDGTSTSSTTAGSSTTSGSTTDSTTQQAGPRGDHGTPPKPTWTSSVTVTEPTDGTKVPDATLQAAAKITSDQASAAALVKVPGTANSVNLRDVQGNVVYVVDVTATGGGDYRVVIDAGNAMVLDSHEGGKGGPGGFGGHGGGMPAPTWTSSVTVTEPTDGTKVPDATLQAAAKIASDQASAAALVKVPGTAGTITLKDVHGSVVYEST